MILSQIWLVHVKRLCNVFARDDIFCVIRRTVLIVVNMPSEVYFLTKKIQLRNCACRESCTLLTGNVCHCY